MTNKESRAILDKMKTTKKHFKLFKKECKYWLNRFDLGSWRADIRHYTQAGLIEGALAYCDPNWTMRTCCIGLQKKVSDGALVNKKVISKAAFHEVCELLLHMLRIIAEVNAGPNTLDEVNNYNHAIIRRMEKAVWEPYWVGGAEI